MVNTNAIYSWYNKHNKYVNYLLISVLLAGTAWFGYSWYKRRAEYSAQQDFSVIAQDYYKLFSTYKNNKELKEIERGLSLQAKKHSSSVLEPFMLAYYADSLIQQGKLQEAVNVLNNVINKIKSDQFFYYAYSTKLAMLKIDMSDEKIKQEGYKQLDQLAVDKNNPLKEMASYYRGYYAWVNGDVKKAREIWTEALKTGNPQSTWLQLIYLRLEEVVA